MSMVSCPKSRFLKPSECLWEEDKADIDPYNSTTFVYNPYISLTLEQQRQHLPIAKYQNHIIHLLQQYQTLVLVGDSGCGKSTQIPQYLLEAGWCTDGKVIGITEPRRVAVTSLATRVAEEKGEALGNVVGYCIRFDDCFNEEVTKIKYMTEGILIREMMADPLLRKYCVIMLDEVHERTLNTDVVMGLLKKILRKNKNLKLIVSSATVNAKFLKKYFNHNSTKNLSQDTAVIMSVEGRKYPVDIFYIKEPVPDYVSGVVNTVLAINQSENVGDILAFLPGQEDVDRAINLLKQHSDIKKMKLLIVPMYGSLPNSEQLKVFRRSPQGLRKVVIATNIAETSITISDIVYVIDCGFMKIRWFNVDTHTDCLAVVPVSKASAEQRAGRAGRTRAGKAYRLYREEDFEKMEYATPPEMQRTDLSMVVMYLKALGIDNILRFNFPSPPPAKNLLSALELLYALDVIDKTGQLTNTYGKTLVEFPISPLYSKCLVKAGEFGCTEEILSIFSTIQIKNIFVKPFGGQNVINSRIAKRKFEVAEGDLLTLLNVYNAFVKNNMSREWCHENFLNYKGLKRAHEMRQQMFRLLQKLNVPISTSNGNSAAVLRCLTSGLFPNTAYLHHSGVYKTIRGDQELNIHPSSVLYTLTQPQWLLFCETLHTDRSYMQDLTVIQPEWLEELAPHFFHKVTET